MGINRGRKTPKSTEEQTNKIQQGKQQEIVDALLGQDLLSDHTYRDILQSTHFTELEGDRKEEIKKILDMLNQHFKEHKIREQAMLDGTQEHAEMYDAMLASMQDLVDNIDTYVTAYEEFIQAEIKKADDALQRKDFNKAYMIANRARNMAQPFAHFLNTVIWKKPKTWRLFSNKGAKLHKMDEFEDTYNLLKSKGSMMKSYEKKFNFLHKEAQDIINVSTKLLHEVHEINKMERKSYDVNGSPQLIRYTVGTDVSNEDIQPDDREIFLGRGNVPAGRQHKTTGARHSLYRSNLVINDTKYSVVQRQDAKNLFALVDEHGKPVVDKHNAQIGYFLFFKLKQNATGKIVGFGIKKKDDDADYTWIEL